MSLKMITKRFAIFSITLLMLFSISMTSASEHQWSSIFNGKDLTGWTIKIRSHKSGDNYKNTFRVENGLLVVSYDQYDNFDKDFGGIFYNEKLSHYRLRLDYRFVGEQLKGGPKWAFMNSGIMLHGQHADTMTIDQNFPISIETQLLGSKTDYKVESTGNVCTPGTHIVTQGKLQKKHCLKSTSKPFYGDQWVSFEVEVNGNDIIRHIVNGEVVFELEKPQLDPDDPEAQVLIAAGTPIQLSSGYISLQAESHPIEFRNIQLMKLK